MVHPFSVTTILPAPHFKASCVFLDSQVGRELKT